MSSMVPHDTAAASSTGYSVLDVVLDPAPDWWNSTADDDDAGLGTLYFAGTDLATPGGSWSTLVRVGMP